VHAVAASTAWRSAPGRPRRARSRRRESRGGVVEAFKDAWQTGNLDGLIRQLAPDAVAVTDGGRLVSAALTPVRGSAAVARLLLAVHQRQPDLTITRTIVNAQPGLVAHDAAGSVLAVISLGFTRGLVDRVWVMRNPAKLTAWNLSPHDA
jgi:RNA polymerase sigma-70 factor (ECF subfamily)